MRAIRTFIPLIGCIVAVLFFAQGVTSVVEKSGLASCIEEHDHDHDSSGAESSHIATHCSLNCICHLALVSESSIQLLKFLVKESPSFLTLHQVAPDGPVFGIDYPPQIAS
jgi:hypothetical protein